MTFNRTLKQAILPLICSGLLLTGCGGSDNKKTTVVTDTGAVNTEQPFDYQALIDNSISETIPGIVLLVENDEMSFLGSAGLADIETNEPMQIYHVMPSGSAGKKLTALLVVMLEQEGVLHLDDKISEYLDEDILNQIENSEAITIKQLLNHTAGIFDYLDDANDGAFFDAVAQADPSELKLDSFALSFALNKPAYAKPGEAFNYSNTGYLLVGLIIDKIMNQHHSHALRTRVLEPLGMNSSFYGGIEKDKGDIISGYFTDDTLGRINTKPFYESMGVADAPLRSHVEDLAHLLEYIVSSDSPLSEDVRNRFFDDEVMVRIDESREYGLGVFKEVFQGKTLYHHGGLEAGYTTSNIYIKETNTNITAYFNCGLSAKCETESDKVVHTILNNELK